LIAFPNSVSEINPATALSRRFSNCGANVVPPPSPPPNIDIPS